MEKLEELLDKASKLFRNQDLKKAKLSCYDFELAKFPYGWVFNVINSWHNWMEKGYKTKFGAYKDPKYAVKAFLDYVEENNINVKKLIGK